MSRFSKILPKNTQYLFEENKTLKSKIRQLEEERETLALFRDAEDYSSFEYNYKTNNFTISGELFNALGYQESELPTSLSELYEFIHTEDLKTIKTNLYNQCILKKYTYHGEYRILTKANTWEWMEGTAKIVEWSKKNKPLRLKCITRMLHDKKLSRLNLENTTLKAKKELKDKDDHLMGFVSILPGIIFETNEKGLLCFTNEKAYEIFDYTYADFEKGINIFDCIVPEDRERAKENYYKPLKNNIPPTAGNEYTAMTKHGKRFPVLIYSTPIIKNNTFRGMRGIIVTITELKKSQEALRKSEENFRQLADNITDAFWLIGFDNQLFYSNKSCESLIESELEAPFASPDIFFNYIHPDDKEIMQKRIQKIQTNPELKHRYEYRILTPSGGTKWIKVRTFPVFNQDGKIYRRAGIATDITHEKTLLQELIHAKEEAEKADKLKSSFLANMSHEIRTPMNGVLGFAELLKDPLTSPSEKMEYINIIQENGKYLLNLINDIIDFAKIEAGELNIIKQPFDLKLFFTNLYKTYKNQYRDRLGTIDFTCRMDPKKTSVTLVSDAFRIEQVLINLITNAFKFTSYGKIEMGYDLGYKINKKRYIKFYVSDTGIGIKKEDQQAIFKNFGQIKTSSRQNPTGAGLGLAISKNLAELLGGYISINSEPDKGSTFSFFLPQDRKAPIKRKSTQENLALSSEAITKKNILIVEDDWVNMEYLKKVLQEKNINILTATSGEKAIELVKQHPSTIDLVLMDIKLPGINGYEATLKIKAINSNIPVVAQTAYVMEEDRKKALSMRCDDQINKPIQKFVLFEKLNNYLYVNKKK
ncbi:MAG: PAS domain-containing protein [Bacteroidota bacterium]